MTDHPHVDDALAYCGDVLSGKLPNCRWIHLATQRFRSDLERAEKGWLYRFDPETAERYCRFIELLPHVKGRWAAQKLKLKLEPWQCFIVVNIFGWLRVSDGKRRFRVADIFVSRKNGKSPLAAAIGLALTFIDGEHGAETYCGATGEKQAHEVFTPARRMCKRSPRLMASLGIEVTKKSIFRVNDGSKFEPVVGDPPDGPAPSCGIVDEYHEHTTSTVYDTFSTGMVGREQPLMLVITTAGENFEGPCYEHQEELESVLEGDFVDETRFGVIYTIDKKTDWTSEEALQMANPNLGVSVDAETLRRDQRNAVENTSKQGIFKIKHLDMWVQSRDPWMNMELWARQTDKDLSIEQFIGERCWIGIDLSSKLDLTAKAYIFKKEDHVYLFLRHYLPEDTINRPGNYQYQAWHADGLLTATSGARIELKRIKKELREDLERFDVQEIGIDPWGATGIEQDLTEDGATVLVIPQNVNHFSDPMKEMEAMVIDGKLWHEDDRLLSWQASNVTCRIDANDNVYPRKNQFSKKIDAVFAAIMALSRAIVDRGPQKSVYEDRGILAI